MKRMFVLMGHVFIIYGIALYILFLSLSTSSCHQFSSNNSASIASFSWCNDDDWREFSIRYDDYSRTYINTKSNTTDANILFLLD